jgi:hypothetical protein
MPVATYTTVGQHTLRQHRLHALGVVHTVLQTQHHGIGIKMRRDGGRGTFGVGGFDAKQHALRAAHGSRVAAGL